MATWIIPALKAVLPHIGTIVSAAKPMFSKTKTKSTGAPTLTEPVSPDIAAIQAAIVQQDDNIKELAEQLQATVLAIQEAAAIAQSKYRRLFWLCLIAIGISLATAAFVYFH